MVKRKRRKVRGPNRQIAAWRGHCELYRRMDWLIANDPDPPATDPKLAADADMKSAKKSDR